MADGEIDSSKKLVFAVAVALAITAALIGDAAIGWVVGLIVLPLLLFVMSGVPVRYSLLGLMYVSLVLENPTEVPASGRWQSPIFMLGALMLSHMNQVTGVSWMVLSGVDLLLFSLLFIAQYRKMTGSRIDGTGLAVPKPLKQLAMLSLAGTAYVWARGLLSGGDFQKSLWQVEKVVYLPVLFFLFQIALRGRKDFVSAGRVLMAAALSRALLAIYVAHFAEIPGDEPIPWVTTHHDSMLWACAIVILLSLVMHSAHPHALRLLMLLGPILVWGMVVNNRRTVWVQIALVFVTLYFATPKSPTKKKLQKVALLASPLALLYVLVGWRSTSGIFKPVSAIRSVLEPANDASTMTRDIENYCIAKTIAAFPILGLGYGHQFYQLIALPPMPHPLEPWLPHNSLLGLWFAAGFIGYTSMTLLWTAGVFFGARAYRAAKHPIDRSAALVSFGCVLIYLIQCYADLGLGAPTGVYMVAASIVIAGKLAVDNGAWVQNPRAKRAAAAPPQDSAVSPAS